MDNELGNDFSWVIWLRDADWNNGRVVGTRRGSEEGSEAHVLAGMPREQVPALRPYRVARVPPSRLRGCAYVHADISSLWVISGPGVRGAAAKPDRDRGCAAYLPLGRGLP